MIQKIKQFLKKVFSFRFIHPEINKRLDTAIDDKINRRLKEQENESDKHQQILNSFVRTYFGKQYISREVMGIAYVTANKEWVKHCRTINSTNKLINLDKKAFEKQVINVINQLNKNNAKNN